MIGVRCSGNPQCGYIGHVSILHGWFAVEYSNFYTFSCIPTKRRNV